MIRDVGKKNLVDDDAAHCQADDDPEIEDVADRRAGIPIIDFPLNERFPGQDQNIVFEHFIDEIPGRLDIGAGL